LKTAILRISPEIIGCLRIPVKVPSNAFFHWDIFHGKIQTQRVVTKIGKILSDWKFVVGGLLLIKIEVFKFSIHKLKA